MKKKALIGGVVILGLLLLLLSMGAFADNPQDVTVSATTGNVLRLTMTETAIDWGGATLENGQTYNDSTTARVSSNKGWNLVVTKSQDLTGVTFSDVIPSTDLTFEATSSDGRVTYVAPAGTEFGTDVTVCSVNRGGNIDTDVSYTLDVPWELEPDTYSATHTYTASQI
jgi:hypothetical protein